MTNWPDLLQADRRHVWHPYAAPGAEVLPVVSAQGTRLTLADGRELIDAMSSWWCAVHGHRHPAIVAAMHAQLDTMPHVMFGGLTHEPAIELAQTLAELAPGDLDHVFFADSGSVSVEVAIKLCLQARPGRRKLMTVRGGYHGDTFGAMAVCDPEGGMHSMWAGLLPEHVFAPRPPRTLDDDWAVAVHECAKDPALAAIIVEPIVQGAGGMWFYDPACLGVLREAADANGLLLVYDEIATGFGRAGATLFAGAAVPPDVMCVGKALTGGTMTLAATLCTPTVAAAIDGPVMHGPTFMANPLACAAARAALGLLNGWEERVAGIQAGLMNGLEPARDLENVVDVRVRGAIGVVQLDRPVDVLAATRIAVDQGVWIRPFRDLIYVMPPYVCTPSEIEKISNAVFDAAS